MLHKTLFKNNYRLTVAMPSSGKEKVYRGNEGRHAENARDMVRWVQMQSGSKLSGVCMSNAT